MARQVGVLLSVLIPLASAHAQPSRPRGPKLPLPARLMVEYLPESTKPGAMLVVSTLRPRFSFVPHAHHAHPGAGVEMIAYRIVVSAGGAATGAVPAVWDSGKVNASSAVGVPCGVDLETLHTYSWSAQWWAAGSDESSPTASAQFDVGPGEAGTLTPGSDWRGSQWVGAGQNEFRFEFKTGAAEKLFVAAPGGAVVFANGHAVTDECGLSAWIDFSANLPYTGVNLAPFLTTEEGATQTVVVKVGSGFYSGSKWRPKMQSQSAARLLLIDVNGAPAEATLSGRVGSAVSVDPFVGGIFNLTLADDEGWSAARTISDLKAARLDGPLRAFALPTAETAPAAAAALRSSVVSVSALPPAPAPSRCTQACDPATSSSQDNETCHGQPPEQGGCDAVTAPQKRWHYAFDRNIIGMAAVQAGAYKLNCKGAGCKGEITLQYCEVFNSSTYTKARTAGLPPFPQWTHLCEPLAMLSVVADTFLLAPSSSVGVLRPSFTWHGFQHVVVSVSDTITFDPQPSSLKAEWTAIDTEATGAISFGGGKDADLLNQIMGITQAGQLSNMAAFVPTDCPTREKHAWLGDGMDVAEELMYNFWGVPMYELFLDTIRAEQVNGTGNLPVNVPAGEPSRPMDISWTAAYPLIAHWLYQYYGNLGVVREHWPTLKLFVDGQRKQMKGDGVPNFFNFGDWCAVESRTVCTHNTGPPAAAANYIMAVRAMVAMAEALGEHVDKAKYSSWLQPYQTIYHKTYFNKNLTSYGKTALEIQTMSTVALGAGVVPQEAEGAVRSALVADVKSRDNHLTVGATGQKWLLRTLSSGGAPGHDVALALAAQDSYPGWGYWVHQGATTCWESWRGIQDPSHPGVKGRPINPPTHNHIFLCGGVGEWMYRSIGGIAPSSPGYGTVKISPQISRLLDPASANATVSTVRGVVGSSWTRHAVGANRAGCLGGRGRTPLLTLRVTVPVGMLAVLHVPLLGREAAHTTVEQVRMLEANTRVWPPTDDAVWLRSAPREEGGALVLETTAAELVMVVHERCSQ